jgi:hypothetical protein
MKGQAALWVITIATLVLSIIALQGPHEGRFRLYRIGPDRDGNDRRLVFDTTSGDYRVESVVGRGPPSDDVYIVSPFRRDYSLQHMTSSKGAYSDGYKTD